MYTEDYINNYLERNGITHQRSTSDIDFGKLHRSKYHLSGVRWSEWLETVLNAFLDPDKITTHFDTSHIQSINRIAGNLYTDLDYGYYIYKELEEEYPTLLRKLNNHIFIKL